MAENALDGDLSPVSDSALATWAGWRKSRKITAARFAGIFRAIFTDDHGAVTEWRDNQGKLIDLRARDLARKRRPHADKSVEFPSRVRGNSIATRQDRTEQNPPPSQATPIGEGGSSDTPAHVLALHRAETEDGTLREWLAEARTVLTANRRGTKLTDDALPIAVRLHSDGVTAAEVTRRAHNMMAEPGLTTAGLRWLFTEWERWAQSARTERERAATWLAAAKEFDLHVSSYSAEEMLARFGRLVASRKLGTDEAQLRAEVQAVGLGDLVRSGLAGDRLVAEVGRRLASRPRAA